MKMKEKIISITNIVKSKVLPFFIIFGLVFHFTLNNAAAWSVGNEITLATFINYNSYEPIYTAYNSFVNTSYEEYYTNYTVCIYGRDTNSNVWRYITAMSTSPFIVYNGGGNSCFYFQVGSDVRFITSNNYANGTSHSLPDTKSYTSGSSSSTITYGGIDYTPISPDGIVYSVNYSTLSNSQTVVYTNFDLDYFGTQVSPNLTGTPVINVKVLEAEKVSRYGADYISIMTNDVDISYDTFVTVSGLSGSTPFAYAWGRSSFIDVAADPPYTYFYLDPNSIPYSDFVIDTVTYENSVGTYGSKTISVNLVFGSPTSIVPPDYDVNTTYNNFTQFIDEGSVSYGLDTLYLGSDSITGEHFYWSSSDVPTRQKWELKALFIPNPSLLQHYTGQATISSSTAYQIYEQFDLIVFGVDDDAFDYIYGSGQFSILDNITTGLDYDLLIKKCVELSTDYTNLRMDELAPTTVLYSDSDCGFVFTRSYLLKKMYFFMGDIDTRLLEFETNLVSENGVLAAVQTKLANIVTNNSSFFDPALEDLTNIVYFCNDISLNGYLPAMVSSLGSIDQKLSLLNYLTSIDNKLGLIDLSNLSYLTNLDSIAAANSSMASDLTYISSDSANIWDSIDGYFPNFYDYLFDIKDNTGEIISILYDMHETIIVDLDLPTIIFNDGHLVDFGNWINDWIVTLPEFDFSEFPTFFTNANSLISDLAGQNDDLIGSLDDPYTYSDSEVHSLGWD